MLLPLGGARFLGKGCCGTRGASGSLDSVMGGEAFSLGDLDNKTGCYKPFIAPALRTNGFWKVAMEARKKQRGWADLW